MPTFEDFKATKSLTAAWDGATPAAEPANTTLTLNHQGMGTVSFQLSGTFSATITFEGTVNGTDWVAVAATNLATNAKATTATAAGIYILPGAAFQYIRARQSARVSGTTVVHGRASLADFASTVASTTSGGAVDTELPPAAALADATANPTTPTVGAAGLVWNGATWDRQPGNPTATFAQGPVASAGASTARPVIVGGNDGGTLARHWFMTTQGAGMVGGINDGNGSVACRVQGSEVDSQANSINRLSTRGDSFSFNGTTWDRDRNNADVTLLASAARTTTQTSADITTYNARGIHVVLDMTTVGTGSVTVTINGKDSVSGKYYLLLSGAAIVSNSTNVYKVYPGLPATANVSANDHVPRVIQIVITANNANSATYSAGYCLLA